MLEEEERILWGGGRLFHRWQHGRGDSYIGVLVDKNSFVVVVVGPCCLIRLNSMVNYLKMIMTSNRSYSVNNSVMRQQPFRFLPGSWALRSFLQYFEVLTITRGDSTSVARLLESNVQEDTDLFPITIIVEDCY